VEFSLTGKVGRYFEKDGGSSKYYRITNARTISGN
jgi:hypothetical protein